MVGVVVVLGGMLDVDDEIICIVVEVVGLLVLV